MIKKTDDGLGFAREAAWARGTFLDYLDFETVEWRENFARLELAPRSDQLNTAGMLHGGVIMSLLDVAGAMSGGFGQMQQFLFVTVNLSCSFLRPHRSERAIAQAEALRRGRDLVVAQCTLIDPVGDVLCASALGTYKQKPR